MKIVIGMLVRNRAWVLQETLDYLKSALEYFPPNQIGWEVIVNNSIDESEEILKKNFIPYSVYNFDNPTSSEKRGTYSYSHLAELRNMLLDGSKKKQANFLFMVDSDILVPENTLYRLFMKSYQLHHKAVLSPLVRNYPHDTYFAHNAMLLKNGNYQHYIPMPKNELVEVDLLGAATWIPSCYFDCRYGFHPCGEDAIFCQQVKESGGSLYVDTGILTTHVMEPGLYVKAGFGQFWS